MSYYDLGLDTAPRERVGETLLNHKRTPPSTGVVVGFAAAVTALIFVVMPRIRHRVPMTRTVGPWPAKHALPPWHDINMKRKAQGKGPLENA